MEHSTECPSCKCKLIVKINNSENEEIEIFSEEDILQLLAESNIIFGS